MMPPSPNALPTQPPAEPANRPAGPVLVEPSRTAAWLYRADLFLRVMVRMYLGLILVFLPWTHLWMFNRFFLYYAPVAHVAQNGAVRGIVSGLGLLNLWIAISDAIHYKES
jgi:hypothetical protein